MAQPDRDLVPLLRQVGCIHETLVREAADEIERLRQPRPEYTASPDRGLVADLSILRNLVERLRHWSGLSNLPGLMVEAAGEIERLQAIIGGTLARPSSSMTAASLAERRSGQSGMGEKEESIQLAQRILDEPGRDPDDDLSMLSRQYLRAIDERERKGS